MKREYDQFTLFSSSIWQTTSTIVQHGDNVFLFDPAYFPSEVEAIADYMNQIRGQKQLVLVLTHGDWDHIAGFPLFTDAIVVAHQEVAAAGRREDQIKKANRFDNDFYINRPYPLAVPRIDKTIDEDTTASEWDVCFIPVPGHTNDMLATCFPICGTSLQRQANPGASAAPA